MQQHKAGSHSAAALYVPTHSEYHVRELQRPIRFLVARSVLCIVYGDDDSLHVPSVSPSPVDPFVVISEAPIFLTYVAALGQAQRPFLVGPYVVLKNEDFEWVFVDYEQKQQGIGGAQVPLTFPRLGRSWRLDTVVSCTLHHIGIRVWSTSEGRHLDVILRRTQ